MAVAETDNPLALFKRLNAIFIDLIGPASLREGMSERLLDEAFESFEHYVKSALDGVDAVVACRGGCASCCTIRVAATAPEVLLIKHYLTKLEMARGGEFVGDLVARIEQAHDATNGVGELDRMEVGEVCPFIENGLCVIYSRRPLACRGHASFSEHACVDALSGEEVDVPISEPHMTARSLIQNALQSALRDAGLGWGIYELNHALIIALKDENCERAWMGGEDIFAPARIADVSQEEMAETFDAIKAAMA
jgi:Fe-S-cluster containining protein